MAVEQGFNSDIVHSGQKFHIQTEDWGDAKPFIVTRVYRSGAVIVSLKTPYESVVNPVERDIRQAVRLAMREQHQRVLDQLISGALFS
jgi:hypothetical protein